MIYHEAIHRSTGGMTNAQAQQRERTILRGGRGGFGRCRIYVQPEWYDCANRFCRCADHVMIGQRPLQKLHVLFTLATQLNVCDPIKIFQFLHSINSISPSLTQGHTTYTAIGKLMLIQLQLLPPIDL